ncbi:MAG TPA: acyl-CoA dehydrogenase, partial [Burkholderiales bacterium]
MDFQYQSDSEAMQESLRRFMSRRVLPANQAWHREARQGAYPTAVVEPLKVLAREAGFWNLFLPGLGEDEPGTRLSNLEYAPLAEIMGR